MGGLLSVYGYSVPAYVAGVTAVIATILTWLFLPESRSAVLPAKTPKKKLSLFNLHNFYDAVTHPEVGALLIVTFALMLAFALLQSTFALFTEHTYNFTAQTNGVFFAYLGLLGVILQLFLLKRILAWLPEHKAALISIVCMITSFVLIAISAGPGILYVAFAFLALGNGVSQPVLTGLISKLTPQNEQGNIMGVNQSSQSFARLLGPIVGTWAYSMLGPRSPYLLAVGILVVTLWFAAAQLRPIKSASLNTKPSTG